MEIITDRAHGDSALASFLSELTDNWEFVASGEASESPFHRWNCAFYLQRSPRRNLYALLLVDFGDPDDAVLDQADDNEAEGLAKVVAVWLAPPTTDESAIARVLLETYRRHGGKYIDSYHDEWRFALG
jgi:hypothetical protein